MKFDLTFMLHQFNTQAIACVVGSKDIDYSKYKGKTAPNFRFKINLLVLAAHKSSCEVPNRKQKSVSSRFVS